MGIKYTNNFLADLHAYSQVSLETALKQNRYKVNNIESDEGTCPVPQIMKNVQCQCTEVYIV